MYGEMHMMDGVGIGIWNENRGDVREAGGPPITATAIFVVLLQSNTAKCRNVGTSTCPCFRAPDLRRRETNLMQRLMIHIWSILR